jgi:uncharacterized membrane protein YvlD (DUF360 family)
MPPMSVIVTKWVIMAVLIYVLSFFFGKRVRMRGLIPVFTVAIVIAPANVFLKEIAEAMNIPDKMFYLFAFAVALNAVILYGATFIVPDFHIENFAVAVGMALLFAVAALLLSRYLSRPLIEFTQRPEQHLAASLPILNSIKLKGERERREKGGRAKNAAFSLSPLPPFSLQ